MFPRLMRLGLAAATLLYAATTLHPATMILSYRNGWIGPLKSLGSEPPASDYHQFIPLMQATPNLLLAIWFVECALFAAAAVQLLRSKRSAAWLFAGGVAVFVAQVFVSHRIAAMHEVFPEWELNFDYLILVVLAVMGATTFWLTRRPDQVRAA